MSGTNMTRWTDTELTIHFDGLDLTTIDATPAPVVAIKNGIAYTESKTVSVVDSEKLTARFDQRETAALGAGDAVLQINYWVDGDRKSTDEVPITIGNNIVNRPIYSN